MRFECVPRFTFWAEGQLKEAIKGLAADTGKTVQELMSEATKDIVEKYRRWPH
jgi:hypothetical protein